MWEMSSTGISTVSNPHFLNVLNNLVLSLVKGEVKRNVLIPILIRCGQRLKKLPPPVKDNSEALATTMTVETGRYHNACPPLPGLLGTDSPQIVLIRPDRFRNCFQPANRDN